MSPHWSPSTALHLYRHLYCQPCWQLYHLLYCLQQSSAGSLGQYQLAMLLLLLLRLLLLQLLLLLQGLAHPAAAAAAAQ
jgi:hypothetical protein